MPEGSKLFTPYRALGLMSNGVPMVVRYIERRKENLIVTVVGNAVLTYGAKEMKLLAVGSPHPGRIISVSGDAHHIYSSCDKVIYAWHRTSVLKYRYEGHKADVHLMVPFGPHLIAVDRLNHLRVWEIKTEAVYLDMDFEAETFEISAIVHPATYLNKVLIGSKQGKLQLWNLKTTKLLYTFKGWDSEVVVLEQAPALDVIAIGLANGKIILHNIKFDETVVEFTQEWGRVTSISFRTDGVPVMVTGSDMGHIALWDLQEKCLASQIREAHGGPVAAVHCLPNEPLMVSNSNDNTIKTWIFDMPDGGGRLLRYRDGHSKPPISLRFYDDHAILTSSEDSTLRSFPDLNGINTVSLGTASYNRKVAKRNKEKRKMLAMPAVTRFKTAAHLANDWDDIVAVHRNRPVVTTWSISGRKMGEILIHKRFKQAEYRNVAATCVELTVCGNFVFIGYDSGHIDKYNIQSGMYRGSFGKPLAHKDGVKDIVTDELNQYLVSAGKDGEMCWWRLKNYKFMKKLRLEESISKMELNRDSGLLALILEDWSINIVDVDTQSLVRKMYGHRNQVTDITFSADSKWLISCSLDKTIRTWDIPSGTCVDCFSVPITPISIAMSGVGDFLATVHADQLGVYLWMNRACFHHVSLRPLPQDFPSPMLYLPSTAADSSQVPTKEGEEASEDVKEDMEDEDEYKSPAQISEELITLALLPTSRWLNLLNLDVIKQRNKPIAPPKVPKAAPFFLPTIAGLTPTFAPVEEEVKADKTKTRSIMSFEVLTEFGRKLKASSYEECLEMLLKMGPSGIEVEVRSLDPDIGGSEELLVKFLEMIRYALNKNVYFEAVQGYLSLYLKRHAEYIKSNENIRETCEELSQVQQKSWSGMCDEIDETLCLISYFKNAALINF